MQQVWPDLFFCQLSKGIFGETSLSNTVLSVEASTSWLSVAFRWTSLLFACFFIIGCLSYTIYCYLSLSLSFWLLYFAMFCHSLSLSLRHLSPAHTFADADSQQQQQQQAKQKSVLEDRLSPVHLAPESNSVHSFSLLVSLSVLNSPPSSCKQWNVNVSWT